MKKPILAFTLVVMFSSQSFSDEILGIRYIQASDQCNLEAQKKPERIFS